MSAAGWTDYKEACVIGTLLAAESLSGIPPHCAKLLAHAPDSFDDLRLGTIAVAIRQLREADKPIGPLTVREQLNGYLEKAGGVLFVDSLTRDAVSLDIAEYEATAVWEGYRTRRLRSVFGKAAASIDADPGSADVIADGVRYSLEQLAETAANQPETVPWIDAGQAASDADVLIGPDRWITRGAGVLLVAYTGTGKSTWTATQSFAWGIGRESLGMRPNGPLRSLIFQAEDDPGDLGTMASSVLAKLSPSQAEQEQLRSNVLVITETAATGVEFLRRRVEPELRRHKPDLLWLNPLSTYFGADLNDQREVAAFFRNALNPLLVRYRCGCFCIHHCPKPTKERSGWTGGQLAYAGAGSADMANWAREVIALRETYTGLYEMSLTKRWRKIGWTDAENRPTAIRLIAHDRKGGQVWVDATPDVLEELGARPYSDAALLALVPAAGIDRAELIRRAADTFSVTERSAAKYVDDARRERRRNINGRRDRFALLTEKSRPRREVYPDRPEGRAVIWLTRIPTADESADEALMKQ